LFWTCSRLEECCWQQYGQFLKHVLKDGAAKRVAKHILTTTRPEWCKAFPVAAAELPLYLQFKACHRQRSLIACRLWSCVIRMDCRHRPIGCVCSTCYSSTIVQWRTRMSSFARFHSCTAGITFRKNTWVIYNNWPPDAQSLYLHSCATLTHWGLLHVSIPFGIIIKEYVHQMILFKTHFISS